MKLSCLYESHDFGSQFMRKRAEVNRLQGQIEDLNEQLRESELPADLRNFGSDKGDGGARYIRRALAKARVRLIAAQEQLREIGDNWRATQSTVGVD